VNALRADEAPGTTFGDRFRRAAVGGVSPRVPDKRPVAGAPRIAGEILKVLSGIRDLADPGDYAELILALVCHRALDPSGWRRFRRAERDVPRDDVRDLFGRAWREFAMEVPGLFDMPQSPRDAIGGAALQEIAGLLDELKPLRRDGCGGTPWGTSDATRLYERILDGVVSLEGRRGGEFHTPQSIVRVMVELTRPRAEDRIHDPSCGTGGMLAGAIAYARKGADSDAPAPTVTGVSLNERGRRLTAMNLLLHGVEPGIRAGALDVLRTGHGVEGPCDLVITNPPFNMAMGDWGRPDFRYGDPPSGNANFGWLQHVLAVLSDRGRAAVVTANNATFSQRRAEHGIRAAMVEDGVVDCVVALPSQLFVSTAIPVSLWILQKDGRADDGVLMVDASGLGEMATRSARTLSDADIRMIAEAYRVGRDMRPGAGKASAFARFVGMPELRSRDYVLSPPAYLRTGGPAAVDAETMRHDLSRILDGLADLRVRAERVDRELERLLGGRS
jgi:type I restriction enzyme M protein